MLNIVRWFDEISIQKKLITIFSIPVVLMLFVSMYVYTNTQSMANHNHWVAHTHKAIARAQELLTLVVDMETGQRGFLITGYDHFLEPYDRSLLLWNEKIDILSEQVSDNPPQVIRLALIKKLHQQWLDTAGQKEIVQRLKVNQGLADMQSVVHLVQLEVGKEIIDAIREELTHFIDVEEKLINVRVLVSDRSAKTTFLGLIIGSILSALVTSFVAIWSSTRLKQRIHTLLTATNHISTGNLTEGKLALDQGGKAVSKDEVAKLAMAFSDMAENLYSNDKKLRDSNQMLKQEKVKAESAVKAKSEFLSTMSHEIRTPLNGVLGIAQIIENETKEATTKAHAGIILSSGQHLLTIINDILDFTRIEENKLELKQEPFSIEQVTSPVCQTLEPMIKEKGVDLMVQNEVPDDVEFMGDSARLRQILFNLVGNAAKFTEQGHIVVRVAQKQKNHELLLSVMDSGLGIPAEDQANIFNSFEQVDTTTTRKFGGTGLGLAIVKKLVRLMGGSVSLESEVGVGSLFTVVVPIVSTVSRSPVEMNSNTNQEALDVRGQRVLIAEDNTVNAFIAKRFCEDLGYHVDLAENGLIATEMAAEKHYNLILMDNHMPQMNGVEATYYIRQTLKKDVTIFAYTADAFQEAHDELLNAGVDQVLTKPLELTSFIDAFNRFLPKSERT
ncbi:CHASE3 domain-containing protein [Vibrio amylolyticus]|uniref:CHASE3 domain-containing protein n=1 Tax=Vibrio amylolyticus TaxID=2847292 RepID=UPI00354D69CB